MGDNYFLLTNLLSEDERKVITSITADTPEAIAALCKQLLEHDEERLIMRQSLLAMHKIPASQAICDRLEA